jgi:methionine synthase I (cobalamin-dependent)
MHPLIQRLLKEGVILTDGSWGTQMQARGLKRGEPPDVWNLTHPDLVEEVARQYVEAGSRVILTNTFGGSRVVLDKHGLAGKAAEINEAGVRISKRAAGDRALVFASIGPSGKMLITGDVTAAELAAAFEEQAAAQARAGADGFVVETMMDIEEALLAVAAAKKTGRPVIASMVFDSGKDKDRTLMGHTPEQAAEAFAQAGVDGLGANCGQGIEGFIPICRRLRAATALPLWMKPNAGLPELVKGEVIYRTTPLEFAGRVPDLVAAGANFIGGCCGTNQAFIEAMGQVIRSLR